MAKYQETKAGVAICPFFTWTSEAMGYEDKSPHEDDVNLIHCTHPKIQMSVKGIAKRVVSTFMTDIGI